MKANIQFSKYFPETFSVENLINNKTLPKTTFLPAKRTKLWELDKMHLCPIVGLCLSIEDLNYFARKFVFRSSLKDDYLLHIKAVEESKTRNPVSKAIQKVP